MSRDHRFGPSVASATPILGFSNFVPAPSRGKGCILPRAFVEDRLRSHPFAAGLQPEAIRLLADSAQSRDFKAGEYLWKQGDPSKALYLIHSGQIFLEILVPHQGPLQFEVVGPGEIIGFSWVIEPHRCRFDARAVQEVVALVLEAKRLRERCEEQPILGYGLLKQLTPLLERRLLETRLRILELHGH